MSKFSDASPGPDDLGFRATFAHPDGEQYTVLLKGDPTVCEAAASCEREEAAHGVKFLQMERWNRHEELARIAPERKEGP